VGQYPPLTVYNEADEPIGEAMLEEILDRGLLHRVIHIVVEDEKGNVLLQLRGPNVYTGPNTWDFAVGGYVNAGEYYLAAARRELEEELGVNGVDLQMLSIRREAGKIDKYDINHFVGTYKAIIPYSTKLVIQESEVAKVEWFDKEALAKLVNSQVLSSR
jgi:isopentenyldiphosphate isomerase